MSYQFYLRQYDRAGTLKRAVIDDFLWLRYRRVVNDTGRLDFALKSNDPAIDGIADLDLFEVYWKNDALGVAWHMDFEAIFREPEYSTDDNGITTFVARCPGQAHILGFRQVAYPSGIDGLSQFNLVAAETVMKTIVDYNCTANAIVGNGRIRNGDLAAGMGFTITIEADAAGGNNVSKAFANGNLLGILRTLPDIAGGDWSFVRTGTATWEFRFHVGQLGTDKRTGSDRVEFSLERGNMRNPLLRTRRIDSATVSITGGQGQGLDRQYVIVNGDDYAADNDIEFYTDARGQATGNSLQSTGEEKAKAKREDIDLFFDTIQTEAVFYSPVAVTGRKTYDLGDLVTANYQGSTFDRKITAVEVNIRTPGSDDPVDIQVETERI